MDQSPRNKEIIEYYERELQLLGFDLHDDLVQCLVGTQLYLESIRLDEQPLEKVQKHLDESRQHLAESISIARCLIGRLEATRIEDGELIPKLKQLIEENESEVHSIQSFLDDRITPESPLLRGAIFRILQESLQNIRKHSGADFVVVACYLLKERIHLSVADNGEDGGIPVSLPGDRYGLKGIQQRSLLFDGSCKIQSTDHASEIRDWVERLLSGMPNSPFDSAFLLEKFQQRMTSIDVVLPLAGNANDC